MDEEDEHRARLSVESCQYLCLWCGWELVAVYQITIRSNQVNISRKNPTKFQPMTNQPRKKKTKKKVDG